MMFQRPGSTVSLSETLLQLDASSAADLQETLKGGIEHWRLDWRKSLPFFQALAKKKLGHLAVDVVDLLRNHRVSLTAVQISIAINACGNPASWQLALYLLHSSLILSPKEVDSVVYNSPIKACKSAGEWKTAIGLVYDMTSHSVPCDARSFSTAIGACEKANEWQSALALLGSMKSALVQQEIFSYTATITAAASVANWMTALAIFQTLTHTGIDAAEATYSTVISACGNGSQWQRGIDLLETAIGHNVCTAVIYNVLSFACGVAGAWQCSLALLNKMQQQHVPPDGATRNTAITVCGRNSQWQRALDLFWQGSKMCLDKVSLAAAVVACDIGDQWQLATLLIEEAISCGFLTPQLFTSAISACKSQWQEAVRLFSRMPQLRVQQGFKTYGAVINACCNADLWPIALALLNSMDLQALSPGGCHVGSVAESLTRTKGREATKALLMHFRSDWLAQSPDMEMKQGKLGKCDVDVRGLKILKTGCYITAIEKPAGIRTETIFEDFKQAFKSFNQSTHLSCCSLVSRLDLPTSGVLPIVLDHIDSPAAAWYLSCFAGRLVHKDYLCLCEGPSLGPIGTKDRISLSLTTRQLPDGGILALVSDSGRVAETEYEVLRRFQSGQGKELILLRAHPVTGRTHQIRVHLAEIKRPLVGDATYGHGVSLKCHRLFLHCHRISLPDFFAGTFLATSDLPEDLEDVLLRLDEIKKSPTANIFFELNW